jgi:hypothetical protein
LHEPWRPVVVPAQIKCPGINVTRLFTLSLTS